MKSNYPAHTLIRIIEFCSGLNPPKFDPQERLRWLNSRYGGLLEVVSLAHNNHKESKKGNDDGHDQKDMLKGDSGSMNTASDVSNLYVQFIHRTVKDSLVQHGIHLGFIDEQHDTAEPVYGANGYELLLCACSGQAYWALHIIAHAMTCAKLAIQSAGTDINRPFTLVEATMIALKSNRQTMIEVMSNTRESEPEAKKLILSAWLENMIRADG